jgi:UDP-N-acetylglucosamine 2-epimerase
VIVTDSGGVQEEASVIKRPVVVVRRSTERPEVLGTFASLVPIGPPMGDCVRHLLREIHDVHAGLISIPTPYGDGSASRRCVNIIRQLSECSDSAGQLQLDPCRAPDSSDGVVTGLEPVGRHSARRETSAPR